MKIDPWLRNHKPEPPGMHARPSRTLCIRTYFRATKIRIPPTPPDGQDISMSHGRVAYIRVNGLKRRQAEVWQSFVALSDLHSSSEYKYDGGTLVSTVSVPTQITTDALLLKRYSIRRALLENATKNRRTKSSKEVPNLCTMMDGLTSLQTSLDQATMCQDLTVIIGDEMKSIGRPIECSKKPPGGTIKDCPYYRPSLVASVGNWQGPPSWPSGKTGGKDAGGDYLYSSAQSRCQKTSLPSWGSSESRGKDTGSDNQSFSAGYLSRLRKGFSSQACDKSVSKDTGGSKDATASGKNGI